MPVVTEVSLCPSLLFLVALRDNVRARARVREGGKERDRERERTENCLLTHNHLSGSYLPYRETYERGRERDSETELRTRDSETELRTVC